VVESPQRCYTDILAAALLSEPESAEGGLWGHLKRTVLANVLFETMKDLVAAFCRGVSRVNGHRNKMGFIFEHDDVKTRAA
jgi:hypothetical protein